MKHGLANTVPKVAASVEESPLEAVEALFRGRGEVKNKNWLLAGASPDEPPFLCALFEVGSDARLGLAIDFDPSP